MRENGETMNFWIIYELEKYASIKLYNTNIKWNFLRTIELVIG